MLTIPLFAIPSQVIPACMLAVNVCLCSMMTGVWHPYFLCMLYANITLLRNLSNILVISSTGQIFSTVHQELVKGGKWLWYTCLAEKRLTTLKSYTTPKSQMYKRNDDRILCVTNGKCYKSEESPDLSCDSIATTWIFRTSTFSCEV